MPEPDSEQIAALVGSTTQRLFYGFLYRRRDSPPTMAELRFSVANALGEDQSQTDRRVRELRRYFDIEAARAGNEHRYLLRGWSATRPPDAGVAISLRRRAEVLAPQRCAQCGRTPLEDHAKLVVDHKVPQSWGGDNEPENLQPLCETATRANGTTSGRLKLMPSKFEPRSATTSRRNASVSCLGHSVAAGCGRTCSASSRAQRTSRRIGNAGCVTSASSAGTTSTKSATTKALGHGLTSA